MRNIKPMIITLLCVVPWLVLAQSINDYRSVDNATGSWDQLAVWQRYNGNAWVAASSSPNAGNAELITVRNGANITITANISLDQLVIESGAMVEITGGTTTIVDGAGTDLVVNGHLKVTYIAIVKNTEATIFIGNGGVYEHNRAITITNFIPTATWQDGSECLLTGTSTSNPDIVSINFACMQQDFYDLTLDYGTIDNDFRTFGANNPLDVRNTLKLVSGYLYVVPSTASNSLIVNNLEIEGGKFVVGRGGGTPTVDIRNDFIINGGSVIVSEANDQLIKNYNLYTNNLFLYSGILNLNAGTSASKSTGRLFVSGSFYMSGGTLINSPAHANTSAGIYFNGIQAQSFVWTGGSLSSSSGGVGRLFFYKTSLGPTSLSEVYGGSSAQVTINGAGGVSLPSGYAAWPSSGVLLSELSINNPEGVTLSTNKTVNTNLYLTNGLLNLSSYTLNMASDTGIVRNRGSLSGAPVFNPGINVSYLYSDQPIYTSYELPVAEGIVNNIVVNTINSVYLSSDVYLSGVLAVNNGGLHLSGHKLYYESHDVVFYGNNYITSLSVSHVNEPASYGGGVSSIARKWNLSGNTNGAISIDLLWDTDLDNGGDFSGTASLWRHNGNSWGLIGSGLQVQTVGDHRILTVSFSPQQGSKLDDLNDYTITGEGQTLPLELTSFTALAGLDGFPMIKWITESETNLLGYNIYRHVSPELEHAERITELIAASNGSSMQVYSYSDCEIYHSGTFFYWLQSTDLDGTNKFYGPLAINYAQEHVYIPEVPLVIGIQKVYPNPFNPHLNFLYGIKNPAQVKLSILNQRGQLIYQRDLGMKAAGTHGLVWDGKDSDGLPCSSGIYIIRMHIGSEVYSRRVSLLK
ncbi:MAG TPA: FlgD immunoglobulin-like domain containing protein [Candidatus Cloacimonadota bacterium]|nr:FlgD immunoglobulin-like domain containing protein [Candidatus Cloacimonadota bacterium]